MASFVATDEDLPISLGGTHQCQPDPTPARLEGIRLRTLAAWQDPQGKTRKQALKTNAYAIIDHWMKS